MNKLIEIILRNGIPITGVGMLESGQIYYEIDGFYKSGNVKIYESDSKFFALGRYDSVTFLATLSHPEDAFSSLTHLNFEWWSSSKTRYDGWSSPDKSWIPSLEKFGYIIDGKKYEIYI